MIFVRFVLFLIVATLLMWPVWNGISVSSDSVNYLSTAENLLRHGSLANFSGWVERIHPPGYAVLLAPFLLLGLSPAWTAFAFNLLLLAVIGLVASVMIREWAGLDAQKAMLYGMAAMTAPAITTSAHMALSDTLFTAEILVLVWLCWKASRADA